MLAIAAEQDLEMYQFDVNTAFLYGIMDADIYMEQPDGYVDSKHPDYVCKLLKSLYGTKQAARQWYQRLNDHMKKNGFKNTEADQCMYYKINDKEYTVIALYVDDLIVMAKTKDDINQVSKQLKQDFDMKELGEVKYCLGIQVNRDRQQKKIWINQEAMIQRVAKRFQVDECKPTYLPADVNSKLKIVVNDGEDKSSEMPYRELVGSLMYIMVCTRPDICNAVGDVSRFCENFANEHWMAALKILKYLKTTQDYSLVFDGEKVQDLQAHADASWASDEDTARSVTGYVMTVNSTAVSWKSQRQKTVAMSSTEAEYMALFAATQEVIWLRRLLKEVKIEKLKPTIVFQDNKSTIMLAKNPTQHSRTKHINTKYHFVREMVKNEEIEVVYKCTEDMIADVLTKAVSKVKLRKHMNAIGLKSSHEVSIGCSKSREGVRNDLNHPSDSDL